jgi:uncharacterized protein (DUF1778 family)
MNDRPSPKRDARLLRFDFLSEVADGLVMAGAALAAGASAENLFVVEAALRHARSAVVEGVSTFREIEASPE